MKKIPLTLMFCPKFQDGYYKLQKNSIRDAHAPQPVEKVFNTMRYRSGETVKDQCQL